MQWTLEEFIQHLKLDPSLNVLFVEGDHDLSFWRSIVPVSERTNTYVYKIGTIEITVDRGGEKAKLFALAKTLNSHGMKSRVKFFADADHDRILGREIPDSVILTDARDRETYLVSQEGFSALCETGFNKDAQFTTETVRLANTLLRPLGVVRVMSERHGEDLPFQQTLNPTNDPGRARRFWTSNAKGSQVETVRLVTSLLQNAQRSIADRDRIETAIVEEDVRLRDLTDDQIIHGKDFVAFVAWRFQCAYEAAQACVNLALCQLQAKLLERPNIRTAVTWVRQGAAAI